MLESSFLPLILGPKRVEVVINDIGKNHIHGYVSAPRYSQSDLAFISNPAGNGAATAESVPVQTPDQSPDATATSDQPRRKLPKPQP